MILFRKNSPEWSKPEKHGSFFQRDVRLLLCVIIWASNGQYIVYLIYDLIIKAKFERKVET